jgi:hypothetical protein
MPNSQMKKTAKGLAAQGRYGDSVLVHMSPGELAGLKALAYENDTEMTINPITGLPEAFKLKKLFKKLLVPALGILSNYILPGNPWGAAALTGALTKASGRSTKQSLMAAAGAGLGNSISGKLAGLGKFATTPGTVANSLPSVTDMVSKGVPSVSKLFSTGLPTDEMIKNVSGETLKELGKTAAKEGAKSFGSSLLTGAKAAIGSEAGRAAGMTALGGKLGAAGLAGLTMASMPKSKIKPLKTDPAKYWVGKEEPLWNPGEWNQETGEFEGQGYGEGEYTEDTERAAIGYADGGNVNTEISDVLSPADASNLSGLAAVNYGDPANVNLNRSAEYGPPQGTYDMPANMPVNRQADLSRDIPMQQRFVQNVPDFDLSGLTTGMSTAGRDPDMAPTPERLGAYYKNLMSGGGGQTAARSLAPLESYMAKVEQGLAPRPPSTTTPADRVGNVASMIGTGSSQGGGQFVMDSEGKLDWVPSGTSFMQRSAGEVDPNIAAMITALGLKIPTTTTPSTDPAYDPVKMKEAILADPAAKAKVLAAMKARAAAGTPTTTAPKMGDTKTDGGKLFVFDGRTWTSIPSFRMASGGSIRGYAGGGSTYAAGGKLLRGPGDGMSDSIPAVIQGRTPQRAALGDGEFVVPADVVASLGNGSTEPGAKQLYAMMDRVRMAKNGRKKQPKAINARKYLPA